ncbi:MAG: YdcF family protein [Defluviitaleaceae bacterium]|nr:YdcF family protein [Defluviitaleaceae bacterium]
MLTTLLSLTPLLFCGGFIAAYKQNKMSLVPSFIFSLLLLSIAANIINFLYPYIIAGGNLAARIVLIIILIPFALVGKLGVYALIVMLLINARIVLKREKKSLAHALTFILAICLIGYLIAVHLVESIEVDIPKHISLFISSIYLMIFLCFIHITHYIIATILCQFSRPKLNQQYIIVHGSGLIDGKITPLLADRVDKAIKFYNKQKEVNEAPKLILSGGQGSDEPRTEAEAMMEYACSRGVSQEDVLLEARSETTMQNMVFSKEIMDRHSENKSYNCIFVTSSYHLLRTGMYARIAGLNIDGIGSKTVLYYLPNAIIREYIAYVVMYKKRYIALVSFAFLCVFVLSLVLWINNPA